MMLRLEFLNLYSFLALKAGSPPNSLIVTQSCENATKLASEFFTTQFHSLIQTDSGTVTLGSLECSSLFEIELVGESVILGPMKYTFLGVFYCLDWLIVGLLRTPVVQEERESVC